MSARAPRSTPGTAHRGAAGAPRARATAPTTTFCWLPPESERERRTVGPRRRCRGRRSHAPPGVARPGAFEEPPRRAHSRRNGRLRLSRDRPVGQHGLTRPGPRGRVDATVDRLGGGRGADRVRHEHRLAADETAGRRTAPRGANVFPAPTSPNSATISPSDRRGPGVPAGRTRAADEGGRRRASGVRAAEGGGVSGLRRRGPGEGRRGAARIAARSSRADGRAPGVAQHAGRAPGRPGPPAGGARRRGRRGRMRSLIVSDANSRCVSR